MPPTSLILDVLTLAAIGAAWFNLHRLIRRGGKKKWSKK